MEAPCIDCGGRGALVAWSSPSFPLRTCEKCGLSYQEHWPRQFEGQGQFQAGLESYYDRMEESPDRAVHDPLNIQRLEVVLAGLERLAPDRSLLDVGCGRGEVVAGATARGWSALGIDLASGAIRVAQANGTNCREVDFFAQELDDERYGLIYMSEFIEHVPSPSRFLSRAHDLLLPKGVLYITTPNYNSFGRRVLKADWEALGTGHVSYFHARTLTRAARDAGLRPLKVRTGGVSIAAIGAIAGRRVEENSGGKRHNETKALREAVYGSRSGRLVKTIADPLIGVSGLGETLKVTFVRHKD